MQPEIMRSTWDVYAKAWSNISAEERQRLLNESVSKACVYTDPRALCHGHAELTAHIQSFQKMVPGGGFETEAFTMHHNHALAHWRTVDASGAALPSGVDALVYDDEGLLVQITGFPVPPQAKP